MGLMSSRPRASREPRVRPRPRGARPRANQRIGTSSKAFRAGPRARRRIGTSSEAFRTGPRARRRVGTSSEALRHGPRANRRIGRNLVVVSWLRYLQGLSNFFGSYLGYPFLRYPTICVCQGGFLSMRQREITSQRILEQKQEQIVRLV